VLLSAFEATIVELAETTGSKRLEPPPGELRARLAQRLVYAMELDSRHLRAYGELTEDAQTYLDERSQSLSELATRLIETVAPEA
jgi:hypothetical protein